VIVAEFGIFAGSASSTARMLTWSCSRYAITPPAQLQCPFWKSHA